MYWKTKSNKEMKCVASSSGSASSQPSSSFMSRMSEFSELPDDGGDLVESAFGADMMICFDMLYEYAKYFRYLFTFEKIMCWRGQGCQLRPLPVSSHVLIAEVLLLEDPWM